MRSKQLITVSPNETNILNYSTIVDGMCKFQYDTYWKSFGHRIVGHTLLAIR
jgi:hypothetical protein